MSLNDALGALNPTTGDIVKGQTGFSTYNGYEWIGSLKSMSAGNGYLYNSNNSKDTKFAYPNKVAMYSRKLNVGQNVSSLESDIFEVVADNKYPGNMTILGMVYDDDQVIKDVEVATFINDECRGAIKTDDSGLVFLTVAGGDGKSGNVIFKVSHNDKIMTINQNLTYEDDAMFGSFDNPYIINLAATGLDNLISGISVYPTRTNDFVNVKINDVMIRSIDVFDISGVKLTEFKDVNSSFKIDFNNYEEGIYFIDITMSDGRNTVYKIVKY